VVNSSVSTIDLFILLFFVFNLEYYTALKQAKKKGNDFEDEEDMAFKAKQKADAQARKEMASKASKGGPLVGGGIKKYVDIIFSSV
jgi:hypothetical protein